MEEFIMPPVRRHPTRKWDRTPEVSGSGFFLLQISEAVPPIPLSPQPVPCPLDILGVSLRLEKTYNRFYVQEEGGMPAEEKNRTKPKQNKGW